MPWGRDRTLIGVHWFDEKGLSSCKDRNGRHTKLAYRKDGWDPRHLDTCEKCIVHRADQLSIELSELTTLRDAIEERRKATP